MSEDTALVPVSSALDRCPTTVRVEKRARITEEDAVSYPECELVSDEELRHTDQVEHKAKTPKTFFKRMQQAAPKFAGADVSSKSLHGFLAAAEAIIPTNDTCAILSSVKVTYTPGEKSLLYVEATGGDVWSVVAIEAVANMPEGFVAMMPLRRAKNAVNAVKLNYESITVGLNEDRICLGPTMVPYGGKVADYPPRPTFRDWEAKAVVPAVYFREICERVVPAQSKDPMETGLHGVLLDYDVCEIEGQMRVLCTAVSTDGHRLHTMRLPGMAIEPTRGGVLPPSVVLSERFFRYLGAVADKKWTGLELSEDQVIARGEDYMAVAKATMRGSSHKSVQDWRKIDVNYQGFWTADQSDLEQLSKAALEASDDDEVRIRIDAILETLELCSWGEGGRKFKDTIPVRRFDGPPAVNTTINGRYLTEAVFACRSGLIRLGFAEELENQRTAPVLIRGEDELFKAIVMPIRG